MPNTKEIVLNMPDGSKKVHQVEIPDDLVPDGFTWPALSKQKHEWTQGLESLEWTDDGWRQLPSLRKHEHTDMYGGPLERGELPRCQHGVYLTTDPHPDLDYEDHVVEWKAPYCYCCYPEWKILWTFGEFLKGYRFLPVRPLEPGEYALQKDKLIDRQAVYPEVFTRPIKLRDRTLTDDLRLQEDPETGKPRLETMGGYVAQAFGHGKAGLGYGPDDDSDDVRTSWLLMRDEQDEQDEQEPVGHTGWVATLPSVEGGIKEQPRRWCVNWQPPNMKVSVEHGYWIGGGEDVEHNWEPYSWPVLHGDVHTNPVTGLGLKESEFFRPDDSDVGKTKSPKDGLHTSIEWFRWRKGWMCRPTIKRHAPYIDCQPPIEWVMRRGRWMSRIADVVPTAKHFAQWARKAEYNRGGGEHRIPLRRTKRWSDDWRGERGMRDLAATLKMYRYGAVNLDTPCGVAQQWMFDGVTREIQVSKMCATAYEKYRQARLALASKRFGKAGWWREGYILGNERGAVTGGSAPQIVAGNYQHRIEEGWLTEVVWWARHFSKNWCGARLHRINVAPHVKYFPSPDGQDSNLHPWVHRYRP